MKHIKIVLLVLLGGLFGFALPGHAQFIGVSLDGAIAYSATKEPVSGGSIGITHPFPLIPNVGATKFSYEYRYKGGEDTLETKVDATTLNFFYHIPVPIFSVTLGLGAGALVTKTKVTFPSNTVRNVNVTTPIGEGFFRFGIPFLHIFDFHIGYHHVSTGEIDLLKASGVTVEGAETKTSFSGGLTTLGFLVAF